MSDDAHAVRDALVRQWGRIAAAAPGLDLEHPSRIAGWRNREVLAHLAVQPRLVVRFLRTASYSAPEVSLAANLSGTAAMAEMVDASAREAAVGSAPDFAAGLAPAADALSAADLSVTVTTLQGPIALVDYLRTRCVEGVVHGCDLVDPVEPDPGAVQVAAAALMSVLAARRPDLLATAGSLDPLRWLDEATGRRPPDPGLSAALPLMS